MPVEYVDRGAYNGKMKIMSFILLAELIVTIIFTITIYITFLGPLWDRKFMDNIVTDFEQGPIVDLKYIPSGTRCSGPNVNNDEVLANTTFEVIGKAHYWGIR